MQALASALLIGVAVAIAQAQSGALASLPYVAVHDPQFIAAADATFMHPDDRLIGLMSGNTPKAYPAGILAQHGLVEDNPPSGPIAVTW
jgi:hypothetical protein